MKDYLNIGSSPYGEDCVQVGSDNYDIQSRIECRAFKHQLERMFGPGPDGAYIAIKSFFHDFGSYKEVVVVFDDEDQESIDWAFKIESEGPERWDSEALEEMKEYQK